MEDCERCNSSQEFLFSMDRKLNLSYEQRSRIMSKGYDPDGFDRVYLYCLSCYFAVDKLDKEKGRKA